MNYARTIFILTLFMIGALSGFIPDFAHASKNCPQLRNTLKAPKNIYIKKNPLRNTRKNISSGQELYFKERKELGCVRCHGVLRNGKGDMAANSIYQAVFKKMRSD